MIKSIAEIKNLGIFSDFKRPQDLRAFSKYNLFYGWNGSGKTTLTCLFRSLEKKILPKSFPESTFNIELEDGSTIESSNLSSHNLSVYVFNKDFIGENINWDETVKSILLISEEKIEGQNELNAQKKKRDDLLKEAGSVSSSAKKLEDELNSFLSRTARDTKQKYQILDTTDSHYLNYDRTKLKKFIDDNVDEIKEDKSLLSEQELSDATQSAKPNYREKIVLEIKSLDAELLKVAYNKLSELLSTQVVSTTIERLKSNTDISSWVEQGLELHKKHKSSSCEFCCNVITPERIQKIENHFNESLKALKEKIVAGKEYYEGLTVPDPDLNALSLYDEFQAEFKTVEVELKKSNAFLNAHTKKWLNLLDEKYSNLFENTFEIEEIPSELIEKYNGHLEQLGSILKRHNAKTENFKDEVKKQKQKLELHYASQAVRDFNYFEKDNDNKSLKDRHAKLIEESKALDKGIEILEQKLSNESVGAAKFNAQLHKFLGHKEISLRFDEKAKGYRIIRGTSRQQATNLSEGEKGLVKDFV